MEPNMQSQFATKADIKELGAEMTRQFAGMATDMVARMEATKDEVGRVIVYVARHEGQLADMAARMVTMATKDDVGRIMNHIDKFTGKVQNYDRATALHGQSITEIQVELKQHSKRLDALESQSTPRPE